MEKIPNFHEISEGRKELRKAIQELDIKDGEGSSPETAIFDKHYKGEKEALDKKASGFKIPKNSPEEQEKSKSKRNWTSAKKVLRKQKD